MTNFDIMNSLPPLWGDKPYYSLNEYCKHVYHEKLYKIALDAGFTCPNRDGTLGYDGCIFCSAGGSGDFAIKTYSNAAWQVTDADSALQENTVINPIQRQLEEGLTLFKSKKIGTRFIAYFQAFTNTYAPVSYLRQVYTPALSHPDIAGISIATRPDCISEECLMLLAELRKQYPDKFIWVELGLQTIHESTAEFIRRGYPLPIFEQAMTKLAAHNIPVIVHVILGLPKESESMQYKSINYLNTWKPFGIKLQLLHILKGTDLADYYNKPANHFEALTLENYISLLIGCIERLSPDIVIHRVTGDGPKDLLIAPTWSLNKRNVLNTLHGQMRVLNSYQGKLYQP